MSILVNQVRQMAPGHVSLAVVRLHGHLYVIVDSVVIGWLCNNGQCYFLGR
jgi:hypothetical protein